MSLMSDYLSCCQSYDELTDIAATIQAYTSIHFNHEEWIKIRFFLMLYSCIIFMWTIIDSIFSDRTVFYFIYATHWILLLNIMLYLICSYVITLVIHERISSQCGFASKKSMQISKRQKKKHNKDNAFEDIPLQVNDNIPSLSQLGLFKWNKFIVFLQNASLAPAIVFPVIFWFVIFPNVDDDHTWYDVLLELNIHGILPIIMLFDFIFSSRTALYIDIYQPLLIGLIYCLWTYIIWTDAINGTEETSYLYNKYYYFELNDYVLWFIANLSVLCFIHLTFAFMKSKVLSQHFLPIKMSSNHTVVIDKNGNIIDSKSKHYNKVKVITGKGKGKGKKKKKDKKSQKEKQKLKKQSLKLEKAKKKLKSKKRKVGVISELTEEEYSNDKSPKSQQNIPIDFDTQSTANDNVNASDDFADFDNIEFFDDNKSENMNDFDSNIVNSAGNSIKEGFKNLIARIDNKNEVKYSAPKHRSDVNTDSDSDSSTSTSSEDSDMESEENDNESEYKMFYSLKGQQSDSCTVTDEENGKFNAFKTRSLATLLNLSKKLHTISNFNQAYNPKTKMYKSEIEYSEQETSGLSDDAAVFGLKSGLSRYDKQ